MLREVARGLQDKLAAVELESDPLVLNAWDGEDQRLLCTVCVCYLKCLCVDFCT